MPLRFGRRSALARLTPEQQALVERLAERLASGTLSTEEVERALGLGAPERPAGSGAVSAGNDDPPPPESEEDAIARAMIERIARGVDAERRR